MEKGKKPKVLKFSASANTIMLGVYADDCMDAHAALARTALVDSLYDGPGNGAPRSRCGEVVGEVLHVSGWRYKTLMEVGAALAT